MKVFKYDTLSSAEAALDNINGTLCFPFNDGAKSYCDVEKFNNDGNFYLIADEKTINILGSDFIEIEILEAKRWYKN